MWKNWNTPSNLRRMAAAGLMLALACAPALALPLGTSTRTVVPSDVQQIISVDYRSLRDSETAQALKKQVLPDALKQFETALKGIGIVPERDTEQLIFVSFRHENEIKQAGGRTQKVKSHHVVGIAIGQFEPKLVLKKFQLRKIQPTKYRDTNLWPMNAWQMTFLDNGTLVFGEPAAIRAALDVRDGQASSLDSNSQVADLITGVDSGAVWSVLDQEGTQNMMRSALGQASSIADYDTVKKRLLGSAYTMNFQNGVDFNLGVKTSDNFSAGVLSGMVKAGMLYKKLNGSTAETQAMEGVTVDSDASDLRLKFHADDKKFQALLHTDLFAAVSH